MNWWEIFNRKRNEALENYINHEQQLQERTSRNSEDSGSSSSSSSSSSSTGDGGVGDGNIKDLEPRGGYDLDALGDQQVRSSIQMGYTGNGIQASSVSDEEGFVSLIGPTGLAIACGCVVAGIFICLGAFLWVKNRRRRQKLLKELTFDCCEDVAITKSAPSSRCPSPRSVKRMSCPDAFGDGRPSKVGSVLVKSWTCDPILDSTLPPECVQPKLVTENIPVSYQQMCEDPPEHSRQSHSSPSKRGRIWFSTFYDTITQQLNVNLIKVKDLPKREATNEEPDPFVKMYLLPDDKTFQVSKSKTKTHSPVFNELHSFQVAPYAVKDRNLRFSVYDVDKRRVRRSLGHIIINLNGLDLEKGEVMCSELESSAQPNLSLGDVQLSLAYIPAKEKVKIGVHKARKLQLNNDCLYKGSYVRIQLYYGHKCHRTKRTVTRPIKENCPFDESLAFTIQGRQLESCSLVITVMITDPHDFNKSDVEYGRVVIGPFMYARGEELAHWHDMVAKPKNITTRWHSLVNPAHS